MEEIGLHRWRVQVSSSNRQLLPCLVSPLRKSLYSIIEEDGQYYLVSSTFESFELPASKGLSACADRIIARLNSLLKLQFQVHSGLVKTGLVLYMDEADLPRLVIMDTIRVNDEVRLYTGGNFFQDTAQLRLDLITKWLEEGNDSSVDEALDHYMSQTDWFNLFKVYEVIEYDTNSNHRNLALLQQKKAASFRYSANNFQVSKYDARHSSKKFEKGSPKPAKLTPMSLSDAKSFIDDLFDEWLKTKQ